MQKFHLFTTDKVKRFKKYLRALQLLVSFSFVFTDSRICQYFPLTMTVSFDKFFCFVTLKQTKFLILGEEFRTHRSTREDGISFFSV